MLRAQVEVSNLDSELIRLRQQLESSQARLAQIAPRLARHAASRAMEQLPAEQVPRDLERLYQQASRPGPSCTPNWRPCAGTARTWSWPGWTTFPI